MRGCQDQIFCLRQIIEKCYERNRDLYLCFVDLEKAYDSIPRNKLFEVLLEYNVEGKIFRVIESIYKESKAAVRLNGEISSWFNMENGVRQGCNFVTFVIYYIY